jgi:hypothetical protein
LGSRQCSPSCTQIAPQRAANEEQSHANHHEQHSLRRQQWHSRYQQPRSEAPYQQRTTQKDNPTQQLIKQAVDYLIQQLEAGKSETLTAYLGDGAFPFLLFWKHLGYRQTGPDRYKSGVYSRMERARTDCKEERDGPARSKARSFAADEYIARESSSRNWDSSKVRLQSTASWKCGHWRPMRLFQSDLQAVGDRAA